MKIRGIVHEGPSERNRYEGKIRSGGETYEFHWTVDPKNKKEKNNLPRKGDLVEFQPAEGRHGVRTAREIVILTRRLPSDTEQLLRHTDIDNFSLKLNKAAMIWQDKFTIQEPKKKNRNEQEPDHRLSAFQGIPFAKLNGRLRSSLTEAGYVVQSLVFQTDWRLSVGLGGASVYETSLTLHHVYGFPYIPGSAVKGTVRSWIIYKYFGNEEKEALKDPGFCHLFGSPSNGALGASQGKVFFFDALPVEPPTIKRDIMNPHHSSYYRSTGAAPRDDEHPIPVTFLTVENTKFQFLFAIRPAENRELEHGKWRGQRPLEVVEQELFEALAYQGIGAKTAVGYGYMSLVE